MALTKEKVSNNIPDDLIFNILSKLPLKSLKRFSCVRKSWVNLFENPQFMSMYRNNFLSKYDNDNSCLLKRSMCNTGRNSLFLLSSDTFENSVKLDWPPPFQEDDTGIFISCSSVNGILCLSRMWLCPAPEIPLKVVLWNPSTEEFKVIPSGSIDCLHGVGIFVKLNGFGYDPVTDDYKLIRYYFFYGYEEEEDYSPKTSWQIYSLRSNCWRELDVEMPANNDGSNVYFLNGVCHWRGHCTQSDQAELVLVSFNLSDEVFYTTPLDCNDCYALWPRTLVVLNDSIAMISMSAGTTCFDILILGELGVKESWTKIFTIGHLPCVLFPIGLGKKGDIFFINDDDELTRFDLSSQIIEKIDVKGERCQIVIYKESLLPIGRLNN